MRYAIYFTPPKDDALTKAGAAWLGRDAFDNRTFGTDPTAASFVETPARYGFHATIKAPFELASTASADDLQAHFTAYCAAAPLLVLPPPKLAYSGNNFILGLTQDSEDLQQLAADIVRSFEQFRAPLSDADIARRKPEQLTSSQRKNLDQWGYPHVMDDFRFHMTLTGPVPLQQRDAVEKRINEHFSLFLDKPLVFSGLGLFLEPARGENFHVVDWLGFKA